MKKDARLDLIEFLIGQLDNLYFSVDKGELRHIIKVKGPMGYDINLYPDFIHNKTKETVIDYISILGSIKLDFLNHVKQELKD